MVVNLCLPHFHTTVHCNKLCADGYDVTNLVSADPALRRRGFKLEYFLRPPVQVTLKFGFQVEIYRVDVELWPWGMDHGQARKMLEISTSSDHSSNKNQSRTGHQTSEPRNNSAATKDRSTRSSERVIRNSCRSNGHQWSLQAQQWGEDAPAASRPASECTSQTSAQPGDPEPEFKLVGRCDLRQEAKVSFVRSNFIPSPLFPSSAPPPPAGCRQEELWRRGPFSLGAVTQLRLNVPFASAASALGLKALAVWGQPARCCAPEEVERIGRAHKASLRQPPQPGLFVASVSPAEPTQDAASSSDTSVPEEFLDPITQEVMLLPMLLPSGVSVDSTTLEEHQKREATWGRAPNDPFTGVPFTSSSQPLPNPQLKGRIDHFLLQWGMMGRQGMLGRKAEGENLQASRLVATDAGDVAQKAPNSSPPHSSNRTTCIENSKSGRPCNDSLSLSALPLKRTLSRGLAEERTESPSDLLPHAKRRITSALPSGSSHEQRLSASLDEALLSALQGRPSFTSNLPRAPGPASSSRDTRTDANSCSACSCPISAYSTPTPSVYRLTCGHLLCRSCLHSLRPADSVSCPACQSSTARRDVARVHL